MVLNYFDEETYQNNDFSTEALPKGEYEGCTFRNCNFTDGDLREIRFLDCEFVACNLSNAKISNASLQDVAFNNCKILGIQFEECNPFAFDAKFNDCQINFSSFHKLKLSKGRFVNCQLHSVDFTQADMGKALVQNCDLSNAMFANTNLEKADLRTSINYSIDPELNRIKGARFSLSAVIGLLDKYRIKIDL